MLKLIIFGCLLSTIHTYPLNEEIEDEKAKEIEELKQILNDVSYINNFKNMMADYVKSQYNNLTDHDVEEIQEYLEEFCHKFAQELKLIIENDKYAKIDKVNDGLPDSTFEDVKNCIKNELPSIKEETAEQITNALRRTIFETRQKIDGVIRNSEFAAI